MLKVVLCPGPRVNGKFRPVVLKPVPVTAACVMVRLVPPVLLSVSDWLWFVPTWTLPKLMLAGAALSKPGKGFCEPCALGLPVLSPWQPTMVARASTTASAFQRAGRWLISD